MFAIFLVSFDKFQQITNNNRYMNYIENAIER